MASAPRINELAWGSVTTDAGSFRDAKLWPGGGRGWDWNETGTSHEPGVQAADVAELLNHGAKIVVIGCGQDSRLQVTDGARQAIAEAGAELDVLPSTDAVTRYNALAGDGDAVGALIHSTC